MSDEEAIIPLEAERKLSYLLRQHQELQPKILLWAKDLLTEERKAWGEMRENSVDVLCQMERKEEANKLGEKLGINSNEKSSWSGDPISWGTKKVWLQPDTNTNTYGRSGFSIHGGLTKGSAGCIDIPW